MDPNQVASACRKIRDTYHRPECIAPDPLEIPRAFEDPRDQEVAAFYSAVFALGRVDLILAMLRRIAKAFPKPSQGLAKASFHEIESALDGLAYRFFRTPQIAGLLSAIGAVLREYGSLEACVLAAYANGGASRPETIGPGLALLRKRVFELSPVPLPAVTVPDPLANGKRLYLFARWMVRDDEIDLGLWKNLSPASLEYPVDTHLLQVCRALGITSRKTQDAKTRAEITAFFRNIEPADPVGFDFSLTRIGLGKNLPPEEYRKRIRSFL